MRKSEGRALAKSHRTLSADGKTLSVEFTGTRADGSVFGDTDMYSRVSGTNGLLGTWRSYICGGAILDPPNATGRSRPF